jgi:2-keto-3-deoxy-L-rhamnonate aldolase RhmA
VQIRGTKTKLAAGDCVYGCFCRYPDPALVELVAPQGFDFLVFDAEHGTIEPRDCEGLVRAAELRGPAPLVRVPSNQPSVILRFLDTGAVGVHVPLVASAEEAKAAVDAVKNPSRGSRGLAGVRAAAYGAVPLAEYTAQANEATIVVIQVETRTAVERVGEIAAVEGVDVVFVGPTDLSQAFGVTGQTGHPLLERAYEEIARRSRRHPQRSASWSQTRPAPSAGTSAAPATSRWRSTPSSSPARAPSWPGSRGVA